MRSRERPIRVGENDFAILEHARRRAVQKDDAGEAEYAVNIANGTLRWHTGRGRSCAAMRAQVETGPGRKIRAGERQAADVDNPLQA